MRDAIEKHPAQLKVLEKFIHRKIGRLPKKRRTLAQKRALVAEVTGKAYLATMTSPKCQRALNTVAKSVSPPANAREAISRGARGGSIALPLAVGVGGALVIVLGAFVVGFVVGTYLAKHLGLPYTEIF